MRKVRSLGELRAFAQTIAADGGERRIILLKGAMGAGKTQFTKFLLEALGSNDVVSPSFAIHHSYDVGSRIIHHFDLFRLENADDLESTGFWDLFESESTWIIVEWAEKLDEFDLRRGLPASWDLIDLHFRVLEDGSREIN